MAQQRSRDPHPAPPNRQAPQRGKGGGSPVWFWGQPAKNPVDIEPSPVWFWNSAPAQQRRPRGVPAPAPQLIGDQSFIDKTNRALDLLKGTSEGYQLAERLTEIRQGDRNFQNAGGYVDGTRFTVSPSTANSDLKWYASTIAHEGVHTYSGWGEVEPVRAQNKVLSELGSGSRADENTDHHIRWIDEWNSLNGIPPNQQAAVTWTQTGSDPSAGQSAKTTGFEGFYDRPTKTETGVADDNSELKTAWGTPAEVRTYWADLVASGTLKGGELASAVYNAHGEARENARRNGWKWGW